MSPRHRPRPPSPDRAPACHACFASEDTHLGCASARNAGRAGERRRQAEKGCRRRSGGGNDERECVLRSAGHTSANLASDSLTRSLSRLSCAPQAMPPRAFLESGRGAEGLHLGDLVNKNMRGEGYGGGGLRRDRTTRVAQDKQVQAKNGGGKRDSFVSPLASTAVNARVVAPPSSHQERKEGDWLGKTHHCTRRETQGGRTHEARDGGLAPSPPSLSLDWP